MKRLLVCFDGEMRLMPTDDTRPLDEAALTDILQAIRWGGDALAWSPNKTDDLCKRLTAERARHAALVAAARAVVDASWSPEMWDETSAALNALRAALDGEPE